MRVFVAGATGVIGRPLVRALVDAGHQVTGMTRSRSRADQLRAEGATPVIADAFDHQAVHDAVTDATPEVVINELTSIPRSLDLRRYSQQMEGNDRIRVEGTRNLVEAATASGAGRMIAQSVAFAYAPVGTGHKQESDSLYLEAPQPLRRTITALKFLEDATLQIAGVDGIVLRYGFFYGPGTVYASDGDWARRVRKRQVPIVGRGGGVFSFIHVDDAVSATVAAVTRGIGIYNIVDDDPAPIRDWLPYYADILHARRPMHVPAFLARILAGRMAVGSMTRLRGASNERAKQDLGWAPRHASWREGFREALG